MRYSFEFKVECVDLYHQGKWPETPEGVSKERFHYVVREWVRLERLHGLDALRHKSSNKEWSAEERYELVAKVIAGAPRKKVAMDAAISPGLLYQWVVNQGYSVNHKRVQRLMHEMGLLGKRPKEKYHSYKGEVGKIADNIIDRDFSTTAPLQKWTTDVSQFSFSRGKCYISPILDMNTNEIISYDLSLSPNMEQIQRMFNTAFKKFPSVEGLIFHSDQEWQYQHAYFRNTLKEHGIIQSMSRKGNCYDNCIMETFFGRLKNEMYYGYEKDYDSFESFSQAVKEYIDYYNNERIQAKTKWMSPVKYRETSISRCA